MQALMAIRQITGKRIVFGCTAGDRSLARHLGVALNVVCGVSRISMEQVIKGVWPFMIAQLVALF
jgi:hypothetical protein